MKLTHKRLQLCLECFVLYSGWWIHSVVLFSMAHYCLVLLRQNLKLVILLHQPPECWDYIYPPCFLSHSPTPRNSLFKKNQTKLFIILPFRNLSFVTRFTVRSEWGCRERIWVLVSSFCWKKARGLRSLGSCHLCSHGDVSPSPFPAPGLACQLFLSMWELSCILQFAVAWVALWSGCRRHSISTSVCHCSRVNFAFQKHNMLLNKISPFWITD